MSTAVNTEMLAALKWREQFEPRTGEDSLERFERIAENFRRETGYLRPGKDCVVNSMEVREQVWNEWMVAGRVRMRAAIAAAEAEQASTAAPAPLDMVLHCPSCGLQHIDAPEWVDDPHDIEQGRILGWKNEPHRSHLCHGCGHIWRPADVPTNGVQAVETKGKADHLIAAPSQAAEPWGWRDIQNGEVIQAGDRIMNGSGPDMGWHLVDAGLIGKTLGSHWFPCQRPARPPADDALLRQALEALHNSVDLVAAEASNAAAQYRNVPSRAAKVEVLKRLAEAHQAAIVAIDARLSEGGA